MDDLKFFCPNLSICEKYKDEITYLQNNIINDFSQYPRHLQYIIKDYFSDCNKPSDKISISIYFPYWFSENYYLDSMIKISLHRAGIYYSHYIRIQDIMMDKHERSRHRNRSNIMIVGNVLLVKSIEILRHIFPCNSDFWLSHDRYMLEYWNSINWENKFNSTIRPWSDTNLEKLGSKLAPLKIYAVAFTDLAKDQSSVPLFEKLIDSYHIGMQMLDDIDDWKEDLEANRYTYFLSLIASSMRVKSLNLSLLSIECDRIKSVLDYLFTICIRYFLDSYDFASKLKLESMMKFLTLLISAVINLKRGSSENYRDILERGTSQLLFIPNDL